MHCKNKCWVQNFTDLLCDFKLIPGKGMSLETICNILTRIVLVVFLILLLFSSVFIAVIFLVVALSIITIVYFAKNITGKKKDTMTHQRENYIPPTNAQKINNWVNNKKSAFFWCDDTIPQYSDNPKLMAVIPNQKLNPEERSGTYLRQKDNQADNTPVSNYKGLNESLHGAVNPKTLIPPVVVPPVADLEYWRTNNLITHSHVNELKQIDDYLSGYQVSTCCGSDDNNMRMIDTEPVLYKNTRTQRKTRGGYKENNYSAGTNHLKDYFPSHGHHGLRSEDNKRKVREDFTLPSRGGYTDAGLDYSYTENENMESVVLPQPIETPPLESSQIPRGMHHEPMLLPIEVKPREPGQMNNECGYNPGQLFTSNLPSNYPSTKCERDQAFKNYNKNLFTQTLEPGVYTYNEINEPINSLMGISYPQQLEPLSVVNDPNGNNVEFIRHDPRLFTPLEEPEKESVNAANIYDGRLRGYGSSDREYENELLGRTDFYYSDVDATRMPNYVVRSKIDTFDFADHYGQPQSEVGNPNTNVMRNLVNNQWVTDSLEFRTGLMEGWQRKFNTITSQRRKFPINISMRG